MTRRFVVAACLLGLVAPNVAAAQGEANDVTRLRGVVVLTSPEQVLTGGWQAPVDRVDVSRAPTLLSRLDVEEFIGQPLDLVLIERMRQRIAGAFAAAGRPFVRVVTPPQDATNGTLQIVATEGRLGAVRVEGARFFGERVYLGAVGLASGQLIDARRLDRAVNRLNANPYRQVTPVAVAGVTAGTTDIVLQAQERRPFTVSTSAGNTGHPRNGEIQIGGSFEWGNAFGRGDLLNARYTTSQDRVINQYGLGYTANLPWRDALSINGSYATTRPDARGSAISTEGASSGASVRYVKQQALFADRLALGIDYRRTDNDVLFGGESIFATAAVVAQAVVEYSKSIRSALGVTSAGITAVYSPGGIGSQNNDAVFEEQRLGARARYGYARVSLGQAGLLPWGFNWDIRATGQISSAPLLASEQMGFGGDGSIRGFDTFAANRDEGVIVNGELRLPSIRGLLKGTRSDADADDLSLFVFADHGAGRQHGEDIGPLSLVTAGPGLRYQVGRFGSLQLAYGRVLRQKGLPEAKDHRFHFQVQVGF